MKYIAQEDFYDCGVACVAMMLSHFDMHPPYMDVFDIVKPNPTYGSTLDDLKRGFNHYGLNMNVFNNSTILDLTSNDDPKIVAYSVDVPHYAIFFKDKGGHIQLYDPFFGPDTHYTKGKFIRKWKVARHMYSKDVNNMLDLDGKESNKLFITVKQK